MGPSPNDSPAPSSISLHTIKNVDLPPPYTEPESTPAPAPQPPFGLLLLNNSAYHVPGAKDSTVYNARIKTYAPQLSNNSDELFRFICRQMKLPVRPLLSVLGTHTESCNDGKEATHYKTDFSFYLDLAETMLRGWDEPLDTNWMEIKVVKDGDEQLAFRGKNLRSRQYKSRKFRAKGVLPDDRYAALEAQAENEGATLSEQEVDLKMWCERFCSDPAPLKSFTLYRELCGFDSSAMCNILYWHIRSLDYRGTTSICLKNVPSSITIYSSHWINKLRANKFVWWICVLLQLWIITWPTIWLMEKRYEVVRSHWNASLRMRSTGLVEYAQGHDERQLGEFWASAVKQAAWGRRQGGAVLTKEDAQRLRDMTTEQILHGGSRESAAERQRIRGGLGGWGANTT